VALNVKGTEQLSHYLYKYSEEKVNSCSPNTHGSVPNLKMGYVLVPWTEQWTELKTAVLQAYR